MTTEEASADRARMRAVRFASGRPLILLVASGVLAIALTFLAAWLGWEGINFAGIVGLLATLWAFLLAAAIYVITANDKDEMLEQIDSLQGSLSGIADDLARTQPSAELEVAKRDFRAYVDALMAKFPEIPENDIVAVERIIPSESKDGRGNTPVIIQTRLRRYSVFHGGRNGGFHVTKLADPAMTS